MGMHAVLDVDIADDRDDDVGVEAGRQLHRHRGGRIQTKRKSAMLREHQAWDDRRAKRAEFAQASGVESLDGQRQERFIGTRDEDRSAGLKFGDASADADLPFGPEQTGRGTFSIRSHLSPYSDF
ncbi:MAG TPA: hypothetical protein VFW22_03165 [Pseudolabrys sp.]|nr:hypothetical protein [Pseudolabrys sp.]